MSAVCKIVVSGEPSEFPIFDGGKKSRGSFTASRARFVHASPTRRPKSEHVLLIPGRGYGS